MYRSWQVIQQTLGQQVSQPVAQIIAGFSKVFVGEIVEKGQLSNFSTVSPRFLLGPRPFLDEKISYIPSPFAFSMLLKVLMCHGKSFVSFAARYSHHDCH